MEGAATGRPQVAQRSRSHRTISVDSAHVDGGVIDLTSVIDNAPARSRAGTKRKRAAAGEGVEDAAGSARRRRNGTVAPPSDVIEIED